MGRGIWAGEQSAVETSGLVCGEQRRRMGRWTVVPCRRVGQWSASTGDGRAGGGCPMETDEPVDGIY
jgi:hypothetical protein